MGNTASASSKSSPVVPTLSVDLTPIYRACRDGDVDRVRTLLPNYSPADLNEPSSRHDGNTCLHIATAQGHDSIVRLLLEHGSYRSARLNGQCQSAYDIAATAKESTRALFLRHAEEDPLTASASRFFDQNAIECFDIVQVEENLKEDSSDNVDVKKSAVQTYRSEEEKTHAINYSSSSKAMCQSRLARFFVNSFHSDEPLKEDTINTRLNYLMKQMERRPSSDYIKAEGLLHQYETSSRSIEQLLHLYTLETEFYRLLRTDCLPLALPLFIHLPELKERYFQGRSYRGMKMTRDQLLIYDKASETPGTLLQTRSFSSTSTDSLVAKEFACGKESKADQSLSVLFTFEFPDRCDQAINLSRISIDKPCLSEYQDEQEVLILPWTLFEVTQVCKTLDDHQLYTVHLKNVNVPKKNLLSTFQWSWVEMKNQLRTDKKIKFDCAFQKYNTAHLKN